MIDKLAKLDRRWIYLAMGLSVLMLLIFRITFPETPSMLVQNVFDAIDELPEGSKVLISFDYDPQSAPELQPMATAWTWHCAKKGHKMYFMCLWPLGAQLMDQTIADVIETEFPHYKYGENFVKFQYKTGNEGVIKVITTDWRAVYSTDANGDGLDKLPITRELNSLADFDLILNVSAGYPGSKEWIQYGTTQLNKPFASGCTGVQAPLLYPYYPKQMLGILGAIKGAAEYEAAVAAKYPEYAKDADGERIKKHTKGIERMGPQLVAHLLVLGLIVLGNVIYFGQRRARGVKA